MIRKFSYGLIGVAILALLAVPLFIHVKVMCQSQFGDCPPELVSRLAAQNSKTLFQAKSGSSKILKADFLVSAFSMQFKLPRILLINTIIKKPAFAILDKSSNNYLLIDSQGTVLSTADSSSLPTVVKDSEALKVGQKASGQDQFVLQLIGGVFQMYQISQGMIQNDTFVVDMPAGIRVLFPLDGDRDMILGALRLIYAKVASDYQGKYQQIDMRYKNPVLR